MAVGPGGTTVPNAPNVDYEYVGQQETMGIGPDGRATNGVKVLFKLGTQGPFSVFLPQSMYTAAAAQAAIRQYAYELAKTAGKQV